MAVRCGINGRSNQGIEALERRLQLSGTPELVLDIEPGVFDSGPSSLANVNGTLLFSAKGQLWSSDGTAAGTQLVKVIRPGGDAAIAEITDVNGVALFAAFQGPNPGDHGLWRSDGTLAGTVLLKALDRAPRALTNVNGTLYFYGNDGINGYELWKSDGTTDGTVMVENIMPGSGGVISQTGAATPMAAVGNRVFFAASNGASGTELWVSDGTAEGTSLVEDINPGIFNSAPSELTNLNGTLMFLAINSTSSVHSLWRSDGTAEGTYMVKDIYALELTNVNGTLFFNGIESGAGSELWKSDGTTGGTQLVKNIYPGSDGSGPKYITAVNGRAFFTAVTPGPHIGLWVSDGTDAGTEPLRTLDPFAAGAYIGEFTDVNGTLYFRAFDPILSIQPFRSDGTVSGTVPVPVPNGGFPGWLTNVNGTLFFSADDAAHGRELWKIAAPVDTIPPTVTSSTFAFETAHQIVVQFSENVSASLSADDLQVATLPGGPTITPSSVTYNAATNTATFAITPRLGDGEYRATLPAGSVSDAAGNPLAQDHTLDFAFLSGDANGDGRVNLQDFNILAINFGQSGRTFSQGNFNYDAAGLVNLQDFNVLASRFGTSLAPAGRGLGGDEGEDDPFAGLLA